MYRHSILLAGILVLVGSGCLQVAGAAAAVQTAGQGAADARSAALLNAAENGDLGQVQSLVAAGTPVDARDALGWAPLIWAAYQGRTDVVEFLLAKGANLHAEGKAGQTALHEAGFMGHSDLLALLLGKGAKISGSDKRKWPALPEAAA